MNTRNMIFDLLIGYNTINNPEIGVDDFLSLTVTNRDVFSEKTIASLG